MNRKFLFGIDVDSNIVSISPSGELLAVGADGYFRFSHFNGTNPIVKYTERINANDQVRKLEMDKSNHFYALTGCAVLVYNITPTTFNEVTGSPIPISAPYSMIVLLLQ